MEESSRAGEAGEAVELGPGAAEDAISLEQGAGSATEATDEMKESNHSGAASNADPAPGGSRTKRKQAKAKAGKGKKRKKGPQEPTPYHLASSVKEDHGDQLFSVQFNPFYEQRSDPKYVFAAVGGYRVTIYECVPSGAIEVLHVYVDPDPEEMHYTCAWSYEPETLQPILAVAGRNGVIRLVRPAEFSHGKSLTGHGQAINELKFHTIDPNLLLSMSADHAMRLWNLKSGACVLILGGEKGHRDEVLSADFNLDCTKIVSCGMDHSLKVWDLDTPAIKAAIKASSEYDRTASKRPYTVRVEHFPIFSTCAVHRNYVDCTRWLGDVLLSKSTDNQIVCWKPGGPPRLDLNEKRSLYLGDTVTVLQRFEVPKCEIWYLRFAVDRGYTTLAVGNQEGKVFVWNLKVPSPAAKTNRIMLEAKRCNSTVRQIAMTKDGSILVAACDDSTLWRWDRTTTPSSGGPSLQGSDGEDNE